MFLSLPLITPRDVSTLSCQSSILFLCLISQLISTLHSRMSFGLALLTPIAPNPLNLRVMQPMGIPLAAMPIMLLAVAQ